MSKAKELLLRKFKEGRSRNSRWSQRAFAQKLGISSGALSEILHGKRALHPQLKKRLAAVLQLSPAEEIDFFEEEIPKNLKPVRHEYFRLSMDQFHLIADWWHFAILNLLKTKGFKANTKWLAQRLGIPLEIAVETWERLFRLGYLKRAQGQVVRAHPRLETNDDFFDLSVRKSHLEDAKLIEASLMNSGVEDRDHTSLTLAVNKKNIKKAKELIRLFQDRFAEEIEAGGNDRDGEEWGDEVYRLSISFFPLTK